MEKKNKKIPKKNYIVLSTIIIGALVLSTIVFFIFNNQKEYNKKIPVIRNHVKEIEAKDLNAYATENPDFLLYFDVSEEEESRKVEEGLIELIDRKKIEVVYVNLLDEDKEALYKDFNSKYSKGVDLNSYPAFIIMKNGKILDIVQKQEREINAGDIEQLLDINEIKGESDD